MSRDLSPSTDYYQADTAIVSGPPFTVCAWINVDSLAADGAVFWVGDKDATNDYFVLWVDTTGTVEWSARTGGPTRTAGTSTSLSVNTWVHVAATAAAADDRAVFLDGGGKGTNTQSSTPSNLDRTAIGRYSDSSPSDYFDGEIAHVSVYDVVLADALILQLSKGFSPFKTQTQDLIAHWPMSKGATDLHDVVGALTLTSNGTPTQTNEPPLLRNPIVGG